MGNEKFVWFTLLWSSIYCPGLEHSLDYLWGFAISPWLLVYIFHLELTLGWLYSKMDKRSAVRYSEIYVSRQDSVLLLQTMYKNSCDCISCTTWSRFILKAVSYMNIWGYPSNFLSGWLFRICPIFSQVYSSMKTYMTF